MPRFTAMRAGSPGYRIARLHRVNSALLARRLKDFPVSWGQIPLLMEVLNEEGRTQGELSREVHIDPARTTRALASLEQQGLVSRRENPACRRDKLVYATAKSEALLGRLLETLEEHSRLLLEGFNHEETRQLLRSLDRMLANMSRALKDQPTTAQGKA